MITPTTKKDLKRYKSLLKIGRSSNKYKGHYFLADDNKAYICDKTGMELAREIAAFNKRIKETKTAQQTLI